MESSVRRDLHVDLLTDRHRGALERLVAADPIANAVLDARLRDVRSLDVQVLGATLLGTVDHDGGLSGAVYVGGSVMPVGGGPADWAVLAHALSVRPRTCTSLVGDAAAVDGFWQVLAPRWGPYRALRANQPLLAINRSVPLVPGDPRVRAIEGTELEAYLPAAAAMFTAELDASPGVLGGDALYRQRVASLVRAGRAFGIVDPGGSVVFKADLATITPHTCQIQGVWVRPDARNTGVGTDAVAAVLRHALTLAPTASLYVNDYNVAARRIYAKLGMSQVGTLATILF